MARQSLKLSIQVADAKKQSFMDSVIEILQLYSFADRIELHDLHSTKRPKELTQIKTKDNDKFANSPNAIVQSK